MDRLTVLVYNELNPTSDVIVIINSALVCLRRPENRRILK